MPTFNPKDAISGGIRGITQFVGTLEEIKYDIYSPEAQANQAHLLFIDVVIEKAGKQVELEGARLTEYLKQSEEPGSKWMKSCEKWIAFGISVGLLSGADDPKINDDLFKVFTAKRIRFLKIPLVQGNAGKGISPGLGFVPLKLIDSDEEVEAPTYGHNAFQGQTVSGNTREKVAKKVSDEAIEFVVAMAMSDEGGLTAQQVESLCMDTAAHRAVVVRGGGVPAVLEAAMEKGLLVFDGDVYLAPGSAIDPSDEDKAEITAEQEQQRLSDEARGAQNPTEELPA